MAKRTGPIEVECDAPPFSVVKACRQFDLHSPEDVRWCRLSHFPPRNFQARMNLFDPHTWKRLLGLRPELSPFQCLCGRERPRLDRYTFTFISGRKQDFLIGQCGRCRTIFWEEV